MCHFIWTQRIYEKVTCLSKTLFFLRLCLTITQNFSMGSKIKMQKKKKMMSNIPQFLINGHQFVIAVVWLYPPAPYFVPIAFYQVRQQVEDLQQKAKKILSKHKLKMNFTLHNINQRRGNKKKIMERCRVIIFCTIIISRLNPRDILDEQQICFFFDQSCSMWKLLSFNE